MPPNIYIICIMFDILGGIFRNESPQNDGITLLARVSILEIKLFLVLIILLYFLSAGVPKNHYYIDVFRHKKLKVSKNANLRRNVKENLEMEYTRLTSKLLKDRDLYCARIEKIASDEQFIQIAKAQKYYISNYGRLIAKAEKPTLIEPGLTDAGHKAYDIDGGSVYADRLVAEQFIDKADEQTGDLIHLDGNLGNCYFENLIYSESKTEPVYIIYVDIRARADRSWYNMKQRVSGKYPYKYGQWYDETKICDEWLNSKQSFIDWFIANYYEYHYEPMQLDKDLLGGERSLYSPNTCCILPQSINILIASSHPRREGRNRFMPLGVQQVRRQGRSFYRSTLTYQGEIIATFERKTPMKAFYAYEEEKQALLKKIAIENQNILPPQIINALKSYNIKPWNENMCCV